MATRSAAVSSWRWPVTYRVALATARVGQPEVLLGLIPGAGGTQRLPRLCGVPLALEMCIGGKPVPAVDAHGAGIVDEIVAGDREALVAGAIGVARSRADAHELRRTRDLVDRISDVEAALTACAERQAALEKARTPLRAPLAAVEAIKAAVTLPFDAGLGGRARPVRRLPGFDSNRARSIHLFFAEREAAKVPGVPKGTAVRDIRRAAVVGAGTMGGGIAMTYANAGIPVAPQGRRRGGAGARAWRRFAGITKRRSAKGRMTAEAARSRDGADHAGDDLRRLRRGRHRHRSGVRRSGAEDLDVRRPGAGHAGRLRARVEHVDAGHRPARRGQRTATRA